MSRDLTPVADLARGRARLGGGAQSASRGLYGQTDQVTERKGRRRPPIELRRGAIGDGCRADVKSDHLQIPPQIYGDGKQKKATVFSSGLIITGF